MKKIKFFITLLIFLCSCSSSQSNELESSPPVPVPSFTPQFNENLKYVDPDNWFSIHISLGWKLETENKYVGENGFLEIGYLPEFMFMQNSLDVCQWIANIDTQGTYGISFFLLENKIMGCTLYPISDINIKQTVIENPEADFQDRFFYIKTDVEYHEEITSSFNWLKPVNKTQYFTYPQKLLRPEDIIFWENTSKIPENISISEFLLPQKAQNKNPSEKVFLEFIPTEVPQQEWSSSAPPLDGTWEDVNEILSNYGYEFKPSTVRNLTDLYKDEKLIINNVYKKSNLYQFDNQSEEIVALIIYSLKDPNKFYLESGNSFSYLIQNDTIFQRKEGVENPMSPRRPPVLYKDELLWLETEKNVHVEVQTSNEEKVFSFASYYGSQLPINNFTTWNDQWILEISNFMVQDGEILNEKFGFEEVFDWGVIKNKPLYFFRKGQRVGISYDGNFLPIYYDYIFHGGCCAIGLNNPNFGINDVRFFAKKDGIWLYVIIQVE